MDSEGTPLDRGGTPLGGEGPLDGDAVLPWGAPWKECRPPWRGLRGGPWIEVGLPWKDGVPLDRVGVPLDREGVPWDRKGALLE